MAKNQRRAPALRDVIRSVLKNMGYKEAQTAYYNTSNNAKVVPRTGATSEYFKGYPDRCCALLIDGEHQFPLYSQDFFDKFKG